MKVHVAAMKAAPPKAAVKAAVKAAMKAGKHVVCEKPLTHTIAESRALRELSRTSGVVTQTGNQGSAS